MLPFLVHSYFPFLVHIQLPTTTDVLNLFVLAAAIVEVATDAGFNLVAECNFDWIPGQLLKREH